MLAQRADAVLQVDPYSIARWRPSPSEAAGAVALVFEAAVAQLTKSVEGYRAGQHVLGTVVHLNGLGARLD